MSWKAGFLTEVVKLHRFLGGGELHGVSSEVVTTARFLRRWCTTREFLRKVMNYRSFLGGGELRSFITGGGDGRFLRRCLEFCFGSGELPGFLLEVSRNSWVSPEGGELPGVSYGGGELHRVSLVRTIEEFLPRKGFFGGEISWVHAGGGEPHGVSTKVVK
ncbi:hypothetical protein HAX54_024778 [Datura stramonium]|uniref:Uncharacterized protein n=1 Tax=Datura stramonium TaxID=4076 RepID=A0ABS8UYG0_DATST|nr:hypothetical protein [Datura stramonium]